MPIGSWRSLSSPPSTAPQPEWGGCSPCSPTWSWRPRGSLGPRLRRQGDGAPRRRPLLLVTGAPVLPPGRGLDAARALHIRGSRRMGSDQPPGGARRRHDDRAGARRTSGRGADHGSLGLAKALYRRALSSDMATAFREEAAAVAMISDTADRVEGVQSLNESAPPKFMVRSQRGHACSRTPPPSWASDRPASPRSSPAPRWPWRVRPSAPALGDAGIAASEVDCLCSYTLEPLVEIEVARNLGMREIRYFDQVGYGGGSRLCGGRPRGARRRHRTGAGGGGLAVAKAGIRREPALGECRRGDRGPACLVPAIGGCCVRPTRWR